MKHSTIGANYTLNIFGNINQLIHKIDVNKLLQINTFMGV